MAATTYIPDSEDETGLKNAAYQSFESDMGEENNSLYGDPIVLGTASERLKGALNAEELKIISAPIDFIGVNTYQPSNGFINPEKYKLDTRPKTMMDWVIDPRWPLAVWHSCHAAWFSRSHFQEPQHEAGRRNQI